MKQSPITGLISIVVLVTILLIGNSVLAIHNARRMASASADVVRTQEILAVLDRIISLAKDAETGQRGYLIVGEPKYFEPYQTAILLLPQQVQLARSFLSDQPEYAAQIERMQDLLNAKLIELEKTIELRRQQGFQAARAVVMTDEGKRVMDELRELITQMKEVQQSWLTLRIAAADRAFGWSFFSTVLSLISGLALTIGIATLARRNQRVRERAASELQLQRDWLSVTLRGIGDAVIATNQRGQVSLMNPVAERLTGWNESAAMGQPLGTVFHIVNETSRAPVENPALRALRDGMIVGLANHTVLIARDGREFAIDDSAAPIFDHDQVILGAILVFRDVTEHRETERRIQQSREFAEGIVQTVPEPLLVLDTHFRVITANPSFFSTFQGIPDETIGHLFFAIEGGKWELPQLRESLQVVLQNQTEMTSHEIKHTFALLGTRHLRFNARLLEQQTPSGTTPMLLVAVHDITDLRSQEADVRRLLLQEQDTTDRLRQVAAASRTLHSAYSSDSVIGVIREETRRILDADEVSIYLGNETLPARQDRLTASLIGRNGDRIGAISVSSKSQRVHTFTENDESVLMQLAYMAAVAIENARLYEELRQTDQRKDEFLATLAHELRNPLAPIRNGLQILRLARANAVLVEETRSMMDRQVTHLVRLVDDLLEVSRINSGKVTLRRESGTVQRFLQQAVEISRPQIEAAGHSLDVQVPAEPISIDGDLSRLAQVFSNLLNNAAKYSDRGGRIILKAQVVGNFIEIDVIDNGFGIDAPMLSRIFEMFQQVDHVQEWAQGGLGIGLTLVQRLIELHGGTVRAESEGLGKGSRFSVSLPLKYVEPVALAVATSSPTKLIAAVNAVPGCRILVVDDNRDSVDSMRMLLQLRGNEVRSAYDGFEAVKEAELFRPRVVLLDIGLPRMNGYEVARIIRNILGSEVILIAMTGWGKPEDRRRSVESGFDHHLVKPVDHTELTRLLDRLPNPPSENRNADSL